MCFNKSINISKEYIKNNYKNIKYIIGYGSGNIKQKGYDYNSSHPILDYIFVTDDIKEFHKNNISQNLSHYKGLLKYNINMYKDLHKISPIIYFPYIKINENLNMKYGIISYNDFKLDMLFWNNLIISGRLHKNILLLNNNDEDLNNLIFLNKKKALLISLLNLKKDVVNLEELFYNIISLSYNGDIRTIFKFENKNKINNILNQNYDILLQEYKDIFYSLDNYISFNKNELYIKDYFQLYSFYYKNFGELPLQKHEIFNKNLINSTRLFLAQTLCNSPIEGFHYMYQKLKKSLKNN